VYLIDFICLLNDYQSIFGSRNKEINVDSNLKEFAPQPALKKLNLLCFKK
jgi:hypothetical protein